MQDDSLVRRISSSTDYHQHASDTVLTTVDISKEPHHSAHNDNQSPKICSSTTPLHSPVNDVAIDRCFNSIETDRLSSDLQSLSTNSSLGIVYVNNKCSNEIETIKPLPAANNVDNNVIDESRSDNNVFLSSETNVCAKPNIIELKNPNTSKLNSQNSHSGNMRNRRYSNNNTKRPFAKHNYSKNNGGQSRHKRENNILASTRASRSSRTAVTTPTVDLTDTNEFPSLSASSRPTR